MLQNEAKQGYRGWNTGSKGKKQKDLVTIQVSVMCFKQVLSKRYGFWIWVR